jgi:hypothetical protein
MRTRRAHLATLFVALVVLSLLADRGSDGQRAIAGTVSEWPSMKATPLDALAALKDRTLLTFVSAGSHGRTPAVSPAAHRGGCSSPLDNERLFTAVDSWLECPLRQCEVDAHARRSGRVYDCLRGPCGLRGASLPSA